MDPAPAEQKQRLRTLVWGRLEEAGAARFPYGSGRIPNFAGAAQAAERLASLPEWQRARVLKCNPDYAQMAVRKLALRQGKSIYMAVPRLQGDKPFIELDAAALKGREARAGTISGASALGRRVSPGEMRPIDAVICGSVAVTEDGSRLGKGGGFSDLEFAIVRSLGLAGEDTPVLTTVHELQVLGEEVPTLPHDIVLTCFATPERVVRCRPGRGQPSGVHPGLLNEEQRHSIPLLASLLN